MDSGPQAGHPSESAANWTPDAVQFAEHLKIRYRKYQILKTSLQYRRYDFER